jgi:hypothetical protein
MTDAAAFVWIFVGLAFLPPIVGLLRGRLLAAFVAGIFVLASIPASVFPPLAIVIWLAALCVGAFAGRKRIMIVRGRE